MQSACPFYVSVCGAVTTEIFLSFSFSSTKETCLYFKSWASSCILTETSQVSLGVFSG